MRVLGCLRRWGVRPGWQERAEKLGQDLKTLRWWIVAASEPGVPAIKRGGLGLGTRVKGRGWWFLASWGSRWAIYRPLSSSPSSFASSTMSTCSSAGKRIPLSRFGIIALLIDDFQFRRYYQIRTALRVSPKIPVKVEVNQLRNREFTSLFDYSILVIVEF